MKAYSRQEDWNIITLVKMALVKHNFDTEMMDVFVTKGLVEVRGPLAIATRGEIKHTDHQLLEKLRIIERVIHEIHRVRDVRLIIFGWERDMA